MNQHSLATNNQAASNEELIEMMEFFDEQPNPMEVQPQYHYNQMSGRYEAIPNSFVLVDSTIDGTCQTDIIAKSANGTIVDPKGIKEGEAVTGIILSGNGADKLIKKDLIEVMEFHNPINFVKIDEWVPEPEDFVFKTVRGAIMMDVSSFFMMEPNASLDGFVMSTKRSYNNPDMREHTIHYLNYFEKFYDREHELVTLYSKLKYFIDCENIAYNKDAFINDLRRYFFRGNIFIKLGFMNEANYSLNLTYKNVKNPNLQYSD